MSENTDCEKLASVLNRASEQGKDSFCRMLWNNQPEAVQAQLTPLLSGTALAMIQAPAQEP